MTDPLPSRPTAAAERERLLSQARMTQYAGVGVIVLALIALTVGFFESIWQCPGSRCAMFGWEWLGIALAILLLGAITLFASVGPLARAQAIPRAPPPARRTP